MRDVSSSRRRRLRSPISPLLPLSTCTHTYICKWVSMSLDPSYEPYVIKKKSFFSPYLFLLCHLPRKKSTRFRFFLLLLPHPDRTFHSFLSSKSHHRRIYIAKKVDTRIWRPEKSKMFGRDLRLSPLTSEEENAAAANSSGSNQHTQILNGKIQN